MPKPLEPEKRAAILADIRAGGKSTRQIGKAHGVSDTTVRRIAKDEGITDAWSRDQTQNATRARVADMKARRAQLAADLLADAERLRQRAWSPAQIVANSPTGPEIVTLDLPPLRDTREAYTALGIALDKSIKLTEIDSDGGTEHARSVLGALAEGFAAAYEQLSPDEPR